MKRVEKYIQDVISGERLSGRYERKAVERHLSDLQRSDIYFDTESAQIVLNFFNCPHHYKGEAAGDVFNLEGWQAFIVASIFGWKKLDGNRRFNYADIMVARKNGKTTLAAGIALYMLILDGEAAAEVYSGAMDKAQAGICWEAAKNIAKTSPIISPFLTFYRSSIVVERTVSSFKPLSKDTKNKDGLNTQCAILDERHAWNSNELFEVIKSGMGARKQPLIFSITTAGSDTSLPYFTDLEVIKDILDGVKVQDNQFAILFSLDPEDDWNDERNWIKANPNLGVSLSWDYMRNEYQDAKNKGGSTEANFKTKNLNIWVDAPEVWIPDDKVAKCVGRVTDADLEGQPCFGGLDLAATSDINAFALFFPNQCALKCFFWIPRSKYASNDRVDYRLWVDQGWITCNDGEVVDVNKIACDMRDICHHYQVQTIAYDPWMMNIILQTMDDVGLYPLLDPYKQTLTELSPPTKELEKMVTSGSIDLMGNPVLRWMFKNVILYRDPNNNYRPHKGKSRNKIDGIVASIMAIGEHLGNITDNIEDKIYTDHTLRTIKL